MRCACHGSLFALATGEPLEGPATEPIETFPVFLRDGRVLADVGTGDAASSIPYSNQHLRLDVSREVALERAAAIVAEAWRSFDHARAHEPPIDERIRTLLTEQLPESPSPVLEVLDDARLALDETIAQVRPRFFAFVASSGLEIGVLGDLLASCFDANLAVVGRRGSEVEDQAVRWVAEFVGFPAAAGAFTSGGTVSNMTALAAARERAVPGSRHTGFSGVEATLYCSEEAHYSIERSAELLGIGSGERPRAADRRRAAARAGSCRRARSRPTARRGASRSPSSRLRARR